MTSQGNATFTADDKELEFPIVEAVEGCSGYDISALMKETGNVTLDVGFVNTASVSYTHLTLPTICSV